VVSPWVKRHTVNSTLYNQASVLRTMEIILGLHPMTTYDAGAQPMFSVFNNAPASGQYMLEKAQVALDTRNAAGSPAARALKMDFREAYDIDARPSAEGLHPPTLGRPYAVPSLETRDAVPAL
jgi:hypothetical protein